MACMGILCGWLREQCGPGLGFGGALAHLWLWERGFDPEGDLCAAIPSKRSSTMITTAMYGVVRVGDLDICRHLYEHGAVGTVRTKSIAGVTPMHAACPHGHLNVAQWLFEMGAAEDIRAKGDEGYTPVHFACSNEHLNVAKWLFAVGAAAGFV